MARLGRNRNRNFTYIGSRTVLYDGVPTSSSTLSAQHVERCVDSAGRPVIDSALAVTADDVSLVLQGEYFSKPDPSNKRYSCRINQWHLSGMLGVDTSIPAIGAAEAMNVVARSNPSRPTVTPPELLQDLIDLPRMVRDVGKLINTPKRLLKPKEQANQYLALQFGWIPFINDLMVLLDLQSHISKRNTELMKLYTGNGLRRRITLYEDDATSTWTYADTIGNAAIQWTVNSTVRKRQWATIRWKPTSPPAFSSPDDDRMNSLSRRLVLGFTPEGLAKGAWNVIPWTWLLGWYSSFGNFALSQSLSVPASHGNINFMSSVEVEQTPGVVKQTIGDASKLTAQLSGIRHWSSKNRSVSTAANPGASIPILGMSRLSILGALTVQRLQR